MRERPLEGIQLLVPLLCEVKTAPASEYGYLTGSGSNHRGPCRPFYGALKVRRIQLLKRKG